MNINHFSNESVNSVQQEEFENLQESPPSQPLDFYAHKKLDHLFHVMEIFTHQVYAQNQEIHKAQASKAFGPTLRQISLSKSKLKQFLNKNGQSGFSLNQVKEFASLLKRTTKQISKSLADAQNQFLNGLAYEISQNEPKSKNSNFLERVRNQTIKVMNGLNLNVSSEHFQKALAKMKDQHRKSFIERTDFSEVEQDRFKEQQGFSPKRAGVIKLRDEVRIEPMFTAREIKKQIKSLEGQILSDRERLPIKKTLDINGDTFVSLQIPLNKSFDQFMKKVTDTPIFERILGNRGIASTNRQEKHLINGYLSSLNKSYYCFRHAIISSKLIVDKNLRKQESKDAALELMQAALLNHLKISGLTLDDAIRLGQPIVLNLSSVSLVTPDSIRNLISSYKSERAMLKDQLEALSSMENVKELNVEGKKIPVEIKVKTFNFGVNEGAVRIPFAMGHDLQHEINVNAWYRMRQEIKNLVSCINELPNPSKKTKNLLKAINVLKTDIQFLMKGERGYLKGNPYEIGARILNLTNLMREISLENKAACLKAALPLIYQAIFNCMSGKDRTGVMDCVAKALHACYLVNGEFPSHSDLEKNLKLREQFNQFLFKFLENAGGLEITEVNNAARGYKITGVANVGDFAPIKFKSLKGLGITAAN